ncbi:MAG: outer membrane lipoprotein-sorting protein [Calditrichaeota bacterium]|nr:MAG: outer membrane lipoprotein-sorting protein [Calditrichota bacterium]
MNTIKFFSKIFFLNLIIFTTAFAQNAEEIMMKSHLNYYYAENDGKAKVKMVLTNKRGKERVREFVMLRLDKEEGGKQFYYTYFEQPSDVKRTTFMVWKNVGEDDSRWIYVPAIDLVKEIAAADKGSSFVGSDFSYEDVSGRHWTSDIHEVLREESVEGKDAFVVKSVAKEGKPAFAYTITWVDKVDLLPLKIEFYDKKDKLEKVFRAVKIEEINGVKTVTHRQMEDVKKKHTTDIFFESIDYNVGLTEDIFTERYLRKAPKVVK